MAEAVYTTRAQVLSDYTIDEHGIIVSPGKFEGEMLYVPVFYSAMLDGYGEDCDDDSVAFDIDEDDIAEFPELPDCKRVFIREDDNGFVRVSYE